LHGGLGLAGLQQAETAVVQVQRVGRQHAHGREGDSKRSRSCVMVVTVSKVKSWMCGMERVRSSIFTSTPSSGAKNSVPWFSRSTLAFCCPSGRSISKLSSEDVI